MILTISLIVAASTVSFVLGAAWCSLGRKNRQQDAIIAAKRNGCASCPVVKYIQ